MESEVIFRPDQRVSSDDLNNIQVYARQSFDDMISDTIDPGQKYAGFLVTQAGPTSINIATGRYYTGGQVYVATTQTQIPLISGLPVVTSKIATVVTWGIPDQESNIQTRLFLVNADTGQAQPQTVTMESTRQAQLDVIYGAESASPARGAISSAVTPVCDVLLSPSGIVSITMDPTNAIGSVADAEMQLSAFAQWQASVAQQISTLRSDLAVLAAQIPANLAATLASLAAAIQAILNQLRQNTTAFFWAVERYINTTNSDLDHAGYAAVVEDGLRFPPGSSSLGAVQLLNPLEPQIVTVNNISLPAYVETSRYFLLPPARKIVVTQRNGEYRITITGLRFYVFVSNFPVVTLNWREIFLRRRCERYGDYLYSPIAQSSKDLAISSINASNVVVNQSSAAGLAEQARRPDLTFLTAQRIGGDPYTPDFPTFWAQEDPTRLIGNRFPGYYDDYYDDDYWVTYYRTGSILGSCMAFTFLNQNNGWLTSLKLFPRDVASSGDVTILVAKTDSKLAPDHTRVISMTTVPVGTVVASLLTGLTIPITPCYVTGGDTYAIIISTPGNHSFWAMDDTERASYNYPPGGLWYFDTTGTWINYTARRLPFVQLFYAQFNQNHYEVQMQAATLSAGISAIQIMTSQYEPFGTSLTWKIQIGGVWQPLNQSNVSLLSANPTIVPLMAVFDGTAEVMPGVDLTQTELRLRSPAGNLQYWEEPYTLGSNTTSIKIVLYIKQWDSSHHTVTANVNFGGNSYTPSTTADVPDPTNPTKLQRTLSYTVPSTNTFAWEIVATSSGNGFPLVSETWAFAF